MMIERDGIAVIVGAVIAALAQIIIAPNIAVAGAMPNFVVAYAIVVAIVRPVDSVTILAFVLGLLFDLVGTGPVGAMAFLLVLAAYLASRAFLVLDNDTLFMPLTILVASCVLIELLYGAFLIGLGFAASPLDAFVQRALPCALYDCIIGLILYPIMAKILASAAPKAQPGKPRLR